MEPHCADCQEATQDQPNLKCTRCSRALCAACIETTDVCTDCILADLVPPVAPDGEDL